jgi:hypothetical protein
MTTDTLSQIVLDEAEAIICAESMRLQHDDAWCRGELIRPHADMPAARSRRPRMGTVTATQRGPRLDCAQRDGPPHRWWPGPPVRATQRSPPAPGEFH